jgi:hypothetical protein
MTRLIVFALLALELCVGFALAQTSGGMTWAERFERYQLRTFPEAKKRADEGDPFAQAVVATHYQLGWDVAKDPELAARYAQRSADAGEPLGQFRLGSIFRAGEGVPKDEERGLMLQAASFKGLYASEDPYSMTAAGLLIFQGKVVGQDVSVEERIRAAAELYKRAADMGYAPAQFNYAMCAEAGHGVAMNPEARATYLRYAAVQGYVLAIKDLLDASPISEDPETTDDKSVADSACLFVDLQKVGAPVIPEANNNNVKVVLQRPPVAQLVKASAVSPDRAYFYAVEGNKISVWELPSARLVGSFELPLTVQENEGEGLKLNSSAEDELPVAVRLNFGPDDEVIISRTQNEKTQFFYFDVNTGSVRAGDTIKSAQDSSLLSDRVVLPNKEIVDLHLNRGEGDLECAIQGFEHYSPSGELIKTEQDTCQESEIRCGFSERLAAALQLPGTLVKEHEWLSPWSPAYETSEMSFLRSWFKWNCRDPHVLVELSTHPRISFIKGSTIEYTLRFPGTQLKRQRFLDFNRDSNELLSWSLSEGYPDSPNPPKPSVINFERLGVVYFGVAENLTPLNCRFRDSSDVNIVTGRIIEKTDADVKYLAMDVSVQLFSATLGLQLGSSSGGEFSPYEKGYAQGSLDAEQAIVQTRALAEGTARLVDSKALSESPLGVAPLSHRHLPELKADVFWNFNSFATRSGNSAANRNVMQIQTDHGLVNLVCLEDENFLDAAEFDGFIIVATTKGVYSYSPSQKAISGSWMSVESANSARAALNEYAAINANKGIVYLTIPDGSIDVLHFDNEGQVKHPASIRFTTRGEPVVMLADNTYVNLGKSTDGIHFSDGQRTYPFEQFDLRLNRPDIVLERLGAPADAVAIARQLREKRLKRMGVTEEMLKPDFHVPELEIVGDVPATTDGNEINVAIKASDSKYPLERLRVYVNNVPVNGRDGELLREEAKSNDRLIGRITGALSASPAGPQTLERTIPVKLAAGRNKIQVSVLNNAGAESLYANAEVNCTAQRPKPTLYAVALGVSDYANPDWNLKYAAKDANDVLERIKAKSGASYSEVKELLLTDKQVTKESVAQIKDFLKDATIDDTVLMFVAGHGLLNSKYDYYFGTTNIDFNNPSENGIAFEEFDDLLASLPCLKKSLLIDTCHAGELDEEEKTLLASAGGTTAPLPTGNGIAMRSIGTRGMNVKAIEGARGASEWYDRLQGLFVDLRRGSGSTILSSSAGAEYALESSEQQNGLFTYAVLEALDGKKEADTDKDGSIEMSELGEYVKKRVSGLTNNKQTPNTRRVNLEGDFTLAKTE